MLNALQEKLSSRVAAPSDPVSHQEIPHSVLQKCADNREIAANNRNVPTTSNEVLFDCLEDEKNLNVSPKQSLFPVNNLRSQSNFKIPSNNLQLSTKNHEVLDNRIEEANVYPRNPNYQENSSKDPFHCL